MFPVERHNRSIHGSKSDLNTGVILEVDSMLRIVVSPSTAYLVEARIDLDLVWRLQELRG